VRRSVGCANPQIAGCMASAKIHHLESCGKVVHSRPNYVKWKPRVKRQPRCVHCILDGTLVPGDWGIPRRHFHPLKKFLPSLAKLPTKCIHRLCVETIGLPGTFSRVEVIERLCGMSKNVFLTESSRVRRALGVCRWQHTRLLRVKSTELPSTIRCSAAVALSPRLRSLLLLTNLALVHEREAARSDRSPVNRATPVSRPSFVAISS